MATKKSSSNYYLTLHVTIYSVTTVTFWLWLTLVNGTGMTLFSFFNVLIVTFITHWLTDYTTSRYTTKLYLAKKEKEFFNVIGFDQWIHAVTLFLTYNYILLN